MQLSPRQIAVGVAFGASTAASFGATVAWATARSGSARELLACAGYLPGFTGAGAALVATPVLLAPRVRRVAGTVAAVGGASALGLVAGKAIAHRVGIRPPRTVFEDSMLPAANAAQARAERDATIAAIDRSADDIVVWVPGTMRRRIPSEFAQGITDAFDGRRVSLVKLPTHPDYQIVQGVADSAEAVRLIVRDLDEQRRPGQRILLAGESQGAWALEVAMQDPAVRDAIDRAVVWGNPGLQPHQYAGAGDGKMLEITDELDVVGRPVNGDPTLVTDALMNVMDGDAAQAWRWLAIGVNNPHSSYLLATSGLRLQTPGGFGRDPHNYREFMGTAARFLSDAPVGAADGRS
ncbi:MAG: hypothetical protein KDC46_00800 [Thermoleophilia bacterium]|nr:hypothetical protein [Thermoleophilia bacterium]